MLRELEITNFAIISRAEVSFGPGLNVISGETGAGKSIILEALKIILGARGGSGFIRSGCDFLEVQALLDLSETTSRMQKKIPDILKGEGGGELPGEILLSRRINSAGRSKVYINGKLASIAVLEELSRSLISICSQNQSLELLEPEFHREAVDSYSGNDLLRKKYSGKFKEWREAREKLEEMERRMRSGALKRIELEAVISELEELQLSAGVRERLEEKIKTLSNAEQIIKLGGEAAELINGEQGILVCLEELKTRLAALRKLTQEVDAALEQFKSAVCGVTEFERELSCYLSGIEVNESELEELREKLSGIAAAERKYRTDTEGLLELLDNAKAELSMLKDEGELDALKGQEQKLHEELKELGASLSADRERAAKSLSKLVQKELSEVNMQEASFSIKFERGPGDQNGYDRVEFLISANKGEPLKPLKQIASGGELARIMLVLKKILGDRGGVNVIVFDEVDSGISGGAARAVGEKLKALSKDSQVICITHLPQVASLADNHLLVKKVAGKRTEAAVQKLADEAKVEEVARMLAGYKITDAARRSARELVDNR